MADVVKETADAYKSCACKNLGFKQKRPLQLFPLFRPLEFITVDILGPLPRNSKKN